MVNMIISSGKELVNIDNIVQIFPIKNSFWLRTSGNFGLGFNIWFSQNWGANLNMAGKVGVDKSDWQTAQKQYALGLIYLLN